MTSIELFSSLCRETPLAFYNDIRRETIDYFERCDISISMRIGGA